MKVLLFNPPFRRKLGNIWRYVTAVLPPLGLGYIAGTLEREGIDVDLVDAQAEDIGLALLPRRLGERRYDLIGITATSTMFRSALDAARLLRSFYPNSTIVMGGPHATVRPQDALDDPAVDMVVSGEGELTFTDIAKGANPRNTPGVLTRDGKGGVKSAGHRPLIKNLDESPYPAYHKLPMRLYHPAAGGYFRLPAIHMLTSRGCPNSCTYCYHIFGRGVRFRSAENVLDEIKYLVPKYGIRELYFYDDTFNARRDRVTQICEGLIRMNLDLEWACLARVEGMDPELLALMKRSGCHAITYGVESADPEILERIHKRISLEQVERVVRYTVESGIICRCGFLLGNPGETHESMERTIQYAIDIGTQGTMFNIVAPYPGTEMFEWGVKEGRITNFDWEQYDFSTPILELPGLTPQDIKSAQKRGHRRFFLRPWFIWLVLTRFRTLTLLKGAAIGALSVTGVLEAAARLNNLLRGRKE